MSSGDKTRRSTSETRALRCDEARILVMGYIDGELGANELRLLQDHLSVCIDCRREEQGFRRLEEVTEVMLNEEMVTLDVDDVWRSIYWRLERSTGWLLLSAGLILLLGYAGWHLLTDFFLDTEAPFIVRLGVGATLGGAIMLLVSIGREVLGKYRSERYREIQR